MASNKPTSFEIRLLSVAEQPGSTPADKEGVNATLALKASVDKLIEVLASSADSGDIGKTINQLGVVISDFMSKLQSLPAKFASEVAVGTSTYHPENIKALESASITDPGDAIVNTFAKAITDGQKETIAFIN